MSCLFKGDANLQPALWTFGEQLRLVRMLRAVEVQAPRIHVGCGINDAPFTAHRAAHRMGSFHLLHGVPPSLAIFRRRQIGLIYQFYNLIPILTVEENMTLPLLLDDKKVDRAHFDSLVQVLGLQHRLGHLPSELSGGQQQRVSIGRALMNNPAILLADEPTGNLDSKNSKEIVELLRQFNKALNQTVIIITHDERIALDADRVIAVEDGKIVKDEVIRQ